jgi:hypothetical protein
MQGSAEDCGNRYSRTLPAASRPGSDTGGSIPADTAVPLRPGNAEIAGGFQMIAGEHSETARKDRQRFGESELGREIGDRAGLFTGTAGATKPRGLTAHVGLRGFPSRAAGDQERIVGCGRVEGLLVDLAEHERRVVIRCFPQVAIQIGGTVRSLRYPSTSAGCRRSPAAPRVRAAGRGRC